MDDPDRSEAMDALKEKLDRSEELQYELRQLENEIEKLRDELYGAERPWRKQH